jgi:hypothetical protein
MSNMISPTPLQNIVLNVSRKHREWRFYEVLSMRVQDVNKVRRGYAVSENPAYAAPQN